jgi:hypothetical protein
VDENDTSQIAGLFSFLREFQRQFQLAVIVVHHARKDFHSSHLGQALRGSSELHGWGDYRNTGIMGHDLQASGFSRRKTMVPVRAIFP